MRAKKMMLKTIGLTNFPKNRPVANQALYKGTSNLGHKNAIKIKEKEIKKG